MLVPVPKLMSKKITIHHIRVIKFFSEKGGSAKINDYEKFLNKYVSMPTARKVIKELIELKIVEKISSEVDKRIKYLKILDPDFLKYL